MKKILFIYLSLFMVTISFGQLSAGDIAFTAFNADGDRDFAFVALVDIPANTTIWFTDNEWDGTDAFNDLNEGELSWTSPSSTLPAGTVVVFTDTDGSPNSPSVNVGTINSGTIIISASNEDLFALLSEPSDSSMANPGFLAGISSDLNYSLSNSGLTVGTNFIDFNNDHDGFEYTGTRSGESAFSDYLPLLMDKNNWQDEATNGENILPINDTSFTILTNDTDSEASSGTQPAANDISSLADTSGEAVDVLKMDMADWGSGDGLPTKVTNIHLKPHTTNTADWTDNILGFTVDNDGTSITPASVTITDTSIDIAFNAGDFVIADGGTPTITLGVYLNTSNIEDGKVLSFMVDADDHGFTADSSGSTFATTFSGGDFHSNDFTIDVTYSKLIFTQQPSNVTGNTTMTPSVTIAIVDDNGNVDVDMDGAGIGLTTTGSFDASATTQVNTVQGIATFSNLIFDEAASSITLTTTDPDNWGWTNITSDTFNVTGAPEISVEGNSTEIASGDTTPDTADHTDFGEVNYQNGATVTRTFTIKNTGNVNLELDGTSIVSISGTNAGDFSITQPSSSTIAGGSSTTFTITFDPSADGVRTATISIDNNDSNEDPYTFDIQGTGYTACTQLFISEYAEQVGGNYIEIYNPTDSDVDMSNFQVWRAYGGGAWSSADVIALSGTLKSGNVYVVARDVADIPFANKYDSHLNYNGDDNIGLAYDDGSGTFVLIDAVGDDNGDPGTGWTVAGVTDATVNHTLVRKSTVDYSNTDWEASAGTNAGDSEWLVLDYTITTQLYHVSDCQQIPLMAVVGHLPGAGNDELVIDENIVGTQTPKKSNNTRFKNTAIGNSVTNAFRIYNPGNTDLNLTGSPMVDISGTNANQFTVSTSPTSPVVANNGYTDFEITFTPTSEGLMTATVSIANDNPFENPYTFTIQGTGYTACSQLFISEYAEQVGGNYIEIYNPTDNDVDMSNFQIWRALNGGAWSGAGTTDIISLSGTLASGNVYVVARDPADIPFANTYDADLDYNGDDNIGLAWNGGSGSTFTLIDAVGDDNGDPGTGWTVAGVANATVNHTLVRKSTVDYSNTDWEASAGTDATDSEWIVLDYSTTTQLYHVSDCQQIPLMAVVGHLPGAGNDELVIDELLAGPQTPKASNNTLFEDRQVGVTTISHAFRIYNAGNTALNLTGSPIVDITGTNAADFSVTSQASTPVAANNGYTDFVIEFNPTDYGVRTATVSIANDNPFENPYVFTIQGTGVNYTPCNTTTGVNIASESFEGSGNWTDSISPATYDAASHSDVWAISTTLGTGGDEISNGSDGTHFWGMMDLDNNNGGNGNYHKITFDPIDISSYDNVVLSFDYFSHGYDGSDEIRYLVKYDNNTTWSGEISLSKNTNSWTTVTINVPANSPYVRLKLEAKQNGGSDWAAFDNIKLVGDYTESTTWDGSAWSNGAPGLTVRAIIDGNYDTTNGDIHTCACKVKSGKTLTISDGSNMLVETDIANDGTILVSNEGSLVQHQSDATLTGSGIYKLVKTSLPVDEETDYVYWSSPLNSSSFTLGDIVGSAWRYYEFDLTQTNPGWHQLAAGDIPAKGMGYAISAPSGTNTSASLTANFVKNNDPFNNGDITVNIYKKGAAAGDTEDYNLLGNPYPSAIDFDALVTDNPDVEGSYYLWTNCAGLVGGHHQESGYTVYVKSGTATAACSDSNNPTAGRYIATGQGFFIGAVNDNSTLTFKNTHRVTSNNDNFVNRSVNRDIAWIDMTDANGKFSQIAVGFYQGATDAYDRNFDAHSMNTGSGFALYSLLNNSKLAIQGLPEWDDTDKVVPLGVESGAGNSITFHLNRTEGLSGIHIYLRDLDLGITHELTATDYTTSVTAGNLDSRFELLFTPNLLGEQQLIIDPNTVLLIQNNSLFSLQAQEEHNITGLTVYDLSGRVLFEKQNLHTTGYQVNLKQVATGNLLLFKVQIDGDSYLVKKTIKK